MESKKKYTGKKEIIAFSWNNSYDSYFLSGVHPQWFSCLSLVCVAESNFYNCVFEYISIQ